MALASVATGIWLVVHQEMIIACSKVSSQDSKAPETETLHNALERFNICQWICVNKGMQENKMGNIAGKEIKAATEGKKKKKKKNLS